MIHVALADDHPLVLDALGELIDQQPDMVVVARWTDGNAVVENIGSVDCDVLVLDLSLPGASGFGVLRALPDVAPTTRTLVYTMYPASLTRWGVLATGAKGWVCKREPPDAVIAGIRRIATGDIEAPEPSPAEGLSPRQRELLLLLCEGASPGDMARQLDVSPSTVSGHLAAMRRKLGVETNGEMMIQAMMAGWVTP